MATNDNLISQIDFELGFYKIHGYFTVLNSGGRTEKEFMTFENGRVDWHLTYFENTEEVTLAALDFREPIFFGSFFRVAIVYDGKFKILDGTPISNPRGCTINLKEALQEARPPGNSFTIHFWIDLPRIPPYLLLSLSNRRRQADDPTDMEVTQGSHLLKKSLNP